MACVETGHGQSRFTGSCGNEEDLICGIPGQDGSYMAQLLLQPVKLIDLRILSMPHTVMLGLLGGSM